MGDNISSALDIYNTSTRVWTDTGGTVYEVGNNSMVISDDILYAITTDGTLLICDNILSSGIGIIKNSTLSSGKNHIVRVKNGSVYTYGDNSYGQCGIGNTDDVDVFTESDTIDGDVVKVSTRGDTTYAITENNELYAWGRNNKYQIGDGTNTNALSPVFIMSGVEDVEAGLEHVIVLKTNGYVYGWGDNSYGQICDTGDTYITEPYKIATSATLIAAGDYHSFYKDSSGTLHGMGNDTSHQVGNPSGVSNPVEVVCGSEHTIAVDENGYMYAWGSNESYQLCVTLPDSETSISEPYNTGIIVTNVNAGGDYTVFKSDDTYYINNANLYISDEYEEIENLSDKTIEEIAIGKRYGVAVDSDNKLWRFASMTDSNYNTTYLTMTPNEIEYPYSITQVDSYRTQSLAINNLGQVIAWGEGYYADGTDKMEISSYPVVISGISNPVQVSRGKNHNLVLDKNGDVWGWGSNSNNPMGSGLGGKVKTVTKLNDISEVEKIAAGTEFSIFLKEDGTIWGVGKNDVGQLGQGDTDTYTTPVQITEEDGFSDISVGEAYVVALKNDTIYAWGENASGQLGNGTTINALTPTEISADLEEDEHFIDIEAGTDFCLALTNFGSVYAWGENGSGELGQGNRADLLVPTKISSLSDVIKIEAGKSGTTVFSMSREVQLSTEPIIDGDTILVPFNEIYESLGAEVSFNEENQIITANNGYTTVIMEIDNSEMGNGVEVITLDPAPQVIDGTVMVTLDAIDESFDANAEYIEELNRIVIDIPQEQVFSDEVGKEMWQQIRALYGENAI